MKIIFLPSEYPTDDNKLAGIFIKDQVNAFKKNGFKVSVFYNYFYSLRRIRLITFFKFFFKNFSFKNKGIKHYYTFLYSTFFDSIKLQIDLYLTNLKLKNYITENGKPDLLICHFSFPVSNTAMILSKKYNIPYIVVEHSTGYFTNIFSKSKINIIKKSLNNALFVVAVRKFLKKKLLNIGVKNKIQVIGNIIDSKIFKIKKEKKNNFLKLLIICELVEKKRVIKLLASLKELKKEIEDFQLTIVGDGPEKNKLLSYVKKNGLKKNIIFSGVLNKYKIAKLMNKSDYLLSVSSVETFGITIAEAISCGLPCIIIDSGGPQDYINQENSYLVNNFSDINKILKKNIKNPKKFNKKKMHLYIKKRFCPNMIVKLYSKTFKKYSL